MRVERVTPPILHELSTRRDVVRAGNHGVPVDPIACLVQVIATRGQTGAREPCIAGQLHGGRVGIARATDGHVGGVAPVPGIEVALIRRTAGAESGSASELPIPAGLG